jgi:hypothetical protein
MSVPSTRGLQRIPVRKMTQTKCFVIFVFTRNNYH